MKVEIKTIWPQEAAEILQTKNTTNRKISELFVNKLANDIVNDAFLLTHQGIAFDVDGNLLDGQHRLAACVKANKPIKILVTTEVQRVHSVNGIQLNSFEIIDSGKTRTVAQMLNIGGVKYANSVAASAKVLALLCAKSNVSIGVTSAQIHKILSIAGESIEKCVYIGRNGSIFKAPSWILGPVCLYHMSFPDMAEKFLREFVDLSAPAGEGSASRTIGAFYQNNSSAAGGQQQISWVKYTCHAINHFHTNKKLTRVCGSDISTDWLRQLNPKITKQIASIITVIK
jgi:hypothetical protein